MTPGHSTDTPIPRGASSRRRPSDSATTPYLETLYALLSPEIRPAIEAVETMCPPSPCCSINGPKIPLPQMVPIRLTPMVQFHDASVQVHKGPPPPTHPLWPTIIPFPSRQARASPPALSTA